MSCSPMFLPFFFFLLVPVWEADHLAMAETLTPIHFDD